MSALTRVAEGNHIPEIFFSDSKRFLVVRDLASVYEDVAVEAGAAAPEGNKGANFKKQMQRRGVFHRIKCKVL